jgi:hypothetical protein
MKKFRVQARAPAEFAPWETTWDGEQFYPATDAYDREMAKNCSIIRVRIQERIYWRWTTLWEGYGTKRERAPERYTSLPVYKWAVYDEWCRKEPQVKIEEVPQKPTQRTWRISPAALYGWTVLTEPEAREVWEFFNGIFDGCSFEPSGHCSWEESANRKDAEIARLKEQKRYNADQVVELVSEVARLKQMLVTHELGKSCIWHPQVMKLQAEEVRLRGWLDLMNGTHSLCTDVRGMCFRALAGEKVPE